MNKLCIYHGNCADGFSGAWIVYKKYPNTLFHHGVYQEAPPDVKGLDVIMVDFSYKRPILLEMAKEAKSILILDHHKSAQEDLVDLPNNVTTIFDMEHSGSMLAWKYFFPNEQPPKLLFHIEDRDLWKFELPFTREIQAAVFSYPYSFSVWDRLMDMFLEKLIKDGKAIERKHFKDIDELLAVTTREMTIGGYKVKVANLPYTLSSDAAGKLAIGMPFGACYWDTPTGRVFSLRSAKDGIDVSEIAKLYGGGGHRNASGFKIAYNDLNVKNE